MEHHFSSVVLPTRPQPDTIVAIYLLKKYGEAAFPGITTCSYQMLAQADPKKDDRAYFAEGMILIDVGGGIFDHHGKSVQTTASTLVSTALGIKEEKSIQKLLAYAERDDFYGKGTQSDDPLDKAFGLSGLIAALNKTHSENITLVIETVLPLIAAHHEQEYQRYHLIPQEVAALKNDGKYSETEVTQGKNKLKVCFVSSDNVQLPGYLRSSDGGKCDVVVQQRSSGHTNILTRPLKKPDLRGAALEVRAAEYEAINAGPIADSAVLKLPGRNEQTPMWYFDPATNSLQNGGINPAGVAATAVPWEKMQQLVLAGLQYLSSPLANDGNI